MFFSSTYRGVDYFTNPLWYVANSTAIAVGTFVLWGGVFYWLAPNNHKSKIERILFFCVGAAIITYMFFGNNLGVLNSTLQYEQGVDFENFDKNVNLVVIFTVAFLLNILWNRYQKNITEVLSVIFHIARRW